MDNIDKIMKKLLTLIGLFISIQTIAQLPRLINLDDQIIYYKGFTISYNNTHEQPNWVFYTLTKEDIICDDEAKRKDNFVEDHKIEGHSAYLDDYKGSGYDRGHLKPSADERCDQDEMNETFYMSNMSPQDPSFNRGGWKSLETYVRNVPVENDSCYVITGPILNTSLKTIGSNEVSVPEFFFKIVYVFKDGKLEVLCFIMPNKKITDPLYSYRISLAELEKFANIDFPNSF